MDLGFIGSLAGKVANNWELVAAGATVIGGPLVVKIKRAKGSFDHLLKELRETRATVMDALTDKNLSQEEAEAIGRELSEDIQAVERLGRDISAVLPAKLRKKLPIGFGGG